MGEVYRAVDSVLGRTVAVKLLAHRHADEPEARARFRREALAAARVSGSRHVVTVFDVGEHDGRPLIVMEYVEGGSVHERLRQGPVPRELALTWLEQAADALDRAHGQGVVHRDVKPANLLLDGDSNLHVSDFGIASTTGQDTLTLPGTVLGTVGYLSPEQARGEPATAASDRYALGVVAFELLTGRRPFASATATTEALAHVSAPVPSAAAIAPDLQPEVDAVFQRALAKDPEERPATCRQLVRDLRYALGAGDEHLQPIVTSTSDQLPTVVAPTVHYRRQRSRGPYGRRRNLVAAAIPVVSALAVALLLGTAGDRPDAQSDARASRQSQSSPSSGGEPPASAPDGVALNDAGYAKMLAGDFEAARPLLRSAVLALHGSGSFPEAYASYNLAFTRFALGRCDGVLGLLDRSERIQGNRSEIDDLRARWREQCAPAVGDEPEGDEDGKPGKGRGRGKGK